MNLAYEVHAQFDMESMIRCDTPESCHNQMGARLVESETGKTLVSCEVYFVDLAHAQSLTEPFELMDIHGVTYEFVDLLDQDYALTGELWDLTEGKFFFGRLVIIHDLCVDEEHRGKKLSKALIEDIERHFVKENDLMALKAFPLENRTDETTESLACYYETLSFKRTEINDILIKC